MFNAQNTVKSVNVWDYWTYKNMKTSRKVKLRDLHVTHVSFCSDRIRECALNLPDIAPVQKNTLRCLKTAKNLEVFECRNLTDSDSIKELLEILLQLINLRRLQLIGIDFGSLKDVRVTDTAEKLEHVKLVLIIIASEG